VKPALADRLMKMCENDAYIMAANWYHVLISNHRTTEFAAMPEEDCISHAAHIYRNLSKMYFAENCEKAVTEFFDVNGYFEEAFNSKIPQYQTLYSLILMRRNIWRYAESQALYSDASDMWQTLESINRILLIFDYAMYLSAIKYKELTKYFK
jgi:hypothetical protein